MLNMLATIRPTHKTHVAFTSINCNLQMVKQIYKFPLHIDPIINNIDPIINKQAYYVNEHVNTDYKYDSFDIAVLFVIL